ncbi:G-protein coupled receptor 54 [Holothuria leucospilota]|uniref:G-protein coupled receptor 54 n=1 Tax=Holothuria leucospilota TaxID=206669 RepID=A0A9Q1BMT2_HOLLE|nr:G-protein coupled receptor 54 [Holothuria leucospilota]
MDEQFESYTITTDELQDLATIIDGASTLAIDDVSGERQTFFTETYAYNVVIMIINISIIFFNGVVIFIVARYREMRNTVTLCFVNLAITDIFYVLAQSSYPLRITTGFDIKTIIPCNLLAYLHFVTITATGLTMTFLAFDRYKVISRPLVILKNRSYVRVMLSFVAVWIREYFYRFTRG